MNAKKVSIIIPVYNVELYLKDCLDSVVEQTHSNLEIILIDDGSTDNSGAICDDYAKNDRRINVIHQNNKGAAAAKNTGLDAATGAYIAFVDSDDYVSESWISDLLAEAIDNQADIVECGFWKMYRNDNEAVDICSEVMTAEEYLAQYFSSWANSLFWNKFFSKDVIGSLRFHQEKRCIDDEFFTYKVISNASKIVRVDKNYYYYRQRLSSAVRDSDHKYQITKDAIDIRPERYEWIKNRYPSLKKYFLINDVNYFIYLKATGDFDSEALSLFKSVARFYQHELFKAGFDYRLLMLWFKLSQSCSEKNNPKQVLEILDHDKETSLFFE